MVLLAGCKGQPSKKEEAAARKERCRLAARCGFDVPSGPRGGTRPLGVAVDLGTMFPIRCPDDAPVTVEFRTPLARPDVQTIIDGSRLLVQPDRQFAQAPVGTSLGGVPVSVDVRAEIQVVPPDPSCKTARAGETLFFEDPADMLARQLASGIPPQASNAGSRPEAAAVPLVAETSSETSNAITPAGHTTR